MDGQDENASKGGATAIRALVLAATFVTGFGAGVFSDGTAEIINAFNATSRQARREIARSGSATEQAAREQPTAMTAAAVTDPVTASPNGTIQWNLSVAPGTQLTELVIRPDAVENPTRLRFYALSRGQAPALVATLWIEGATGAAISLPAGYYRVGSTRIREGLAWDRRAGDETYLNKPLRIEILDPDQSPPVLRVDAEGMIRSTSTVEPRRTARRTSGRPRTEREYEGLGSSSTDGGVDTYGR